MGTAIKHPVPADRVRPSFVIFDSWALWRSSLSVHPWASECPDVKIYKWRLNPVWHRMLYSCTHTAALGIKGLGCPVPRIILNLPVKFVIHYCVSSYCAFTHEDMPSVCPSVCPSVTVRYCVRLLNISWKFFLSESDLPWIIFLFRETQFWNFTMVTDRQKVAVRLLWCHQFGMKGQQISQVYT